MKVFQPKNNQWIFIILNFYIYLHTISMKISLHKNSTEKFCKKHFCKIKKNWIGAYWKSYEFYILYWILNLLQLTYINDFLELQNNK